jgi:Plasma-membrane choline transporter
VVIILYWLSSFVINCQRALIGTMIAQWYFSTTRLWLTGTLSRGLKVLFFHIGTMFYHSLFMALIRPFRFSCHIFKRYFDTIEYANKTQMFMIKCCKCCVTLYENKFKYMMNENIYQVRRL